MTQAARNKSQSGIAGGADSKGLIKTGLIVKDNIVRVNGRQRSLQGIGPANVFLDREILGNLRLQAGNLIGNVTDQGVGGGHQDLQIGQTQGDIDQSEREASVRPLKNGRSRHLRWRCPSG